MTAPDRPGDRDQQQAAEAFSEWGSFIAGDGYRSIGKLDDQERVDKIAASLAAARAEEAAQWRAKLEALRNLADSYGRWPFRVDPLDVARKIDAVLDAE